MNRFTFITLITIFIISINSYADGILVCGEDGYCYYEEEDLVADDFINDLLYEDTDIVPLADEIQIAQVRTLSLNIYPKNGNVTLVNGELVYTPNPGFYGEDYFTYIDDDGNLRTVKLFIKRPSDNTPNNFSVSEVIPISEPELEPEPIIPTTYTTKSGEPLLITIAGDYKPSEQALAINNPNHGNIVNNNNGTLTYISEPDYSGKDSFSYKIDDKYTFIIEIEISKQQVSIMEELPQFIYADHIAVVRSKMLLTIDISANYDKKTQILVIHGSANSNIKQAKDVLFYFSNPEFKGYDNFSYTVIDKNDASNSNTYTARIEVQEDSSFKQVSTNSCRIFAVNDKNFADSQLISIDPAGYISTEIGPLYYGLDMEGMAIDPISNLLYGVTGWDYSLASDGWLYKINPNNGDIEPIGDTGFSELVALTFHSDGTLWGWSNGGSKDGVQEPGLILIDQKTGNSQLIYPMPPGLFNQQGESGIEGLAWSSNGSILYASEGRNLWQWSCETGFELKCSNFPGKQVEALETLADGMLLFSINNHTGNTAYVYNPENCNVIYQRSFTTSTSYTDVEALVWPLNCQLSAPILNEKVTFDGFDSNQKGICLTEPQWIEVTGKVTIPEGSLAYLKTSWASSADVTDKCITCGSCSQKWQTITSVSNQFKIKAWWPGVAKADTSVTTSYIVELHDKERNLISTNEVTLIGDPNACEITVKNDKPITKSTITDNEPTITKPTISDPPSTPPVDPSVPSVTNLRDYLGNSILQINNDGSFTIQFEGKVYSYKFKGSLPALPNKSLSVSTTDDINGDGFSDYLVTEQLANGASREFKLLNFGGIEAQSIANATIPDRVTIGITLKNNSLNISNAGIITIEHKGQHLYTFEGNTPLLPLPGALTVLLQNDINGDKYSDYLVIDGNGKEYNILYLGVD
ncbi:MAG TPA: hypothetical protein ENK59_03035 [Thioploca sp.]|nr:hypothetical protein [Thioploca sp.]